MDAGMISNSTLEYYNRHAMEYATTTNAADMSDNYSRFLKHVKTNGCIADIGCGGGRDLKFFREKGYKAFGLDASEELCRIASEYSGCPVTCSDFLSWNPDRKFDAFWANASLLHLTEPDVLSFFSTKTTYLNDEGVIYFSMKTGIDEGLDDKGRFFTPFSEKLLKRITMALPGCMIVDRWSNSDSLDRQDVHWESVIISV